MRQIIDQLKSRDKQTEPCIALFKSYNLLIKDIKSLSLTNSIQQKESQQEIQSLKQIQSLNIIKISDQHSLLHEKDNVIQILKDELLAHQLELVHSDQQKKDLNAKILVLETEQKELIRQLIEKNNLVVEQKMGDAKVNLQIKSIPLKVYNVPAKKTKTYDIHTSDITCIALSESFNLLATGSADKSVIITDLQTNAQKTLTGCMQGILHYSSRFDFKGIMSVQFNKRESMLVCGSNDNSIKVYTTQTGRMAHSLMGHIGKVVSTKFTSTDGVVSASHDRTIKIWDLTKGYCIKTLLTLSSCNDVCLVEQDGNVIISGHLDNGIRLWDTRTGSMVSEILGHHCGQITGVLYLPQKNAVLTTSRDDTIKLIDIRMDQQEIQCYKSDGYRTAFNWSKSCVSPDCKYVASGSADGSVYFWNLDTCVFEKQISGGGSAVSGVVWGDLVFSAEKDKTVSVYC